MVNMRVLLILISSLFAQVTSAQGTIEVIVKDIRSEQGTILVALFNSDKSFLKDPFDGKVLKIFGPEVRVVFSGLKQGDYAVSIIHDENNNGKLDKNAIGIPKEGFGFGNNAMGSFGPPSFDKAKVVIKDDHIIQEISLKYF